MTQDIEFEDIFIDIVEVEVGGLPGSSVVIGRILNRSKVIDIHIIWNNNDTTRVLTSCPFDPSRSSSQALHFHILIKLPIVPLIATDKAIGCFGSNGTYGTCPKGIFFPENIPDIQMGIGLVISREVQIDIGHLVPIETKEGLKGNVLAILIIGMATLFTLFIRHIETRTIGTICDEFGMLAVWTDVVRGHGIDFCNPDHGGDKTRADRPP